MLREALSSTLSCLSEQFHAEREELLCLLRKDGILYQSPVQPVLSRDGASARWMLDSLSVTLTSRGSELVSRCILELLKRFDGRQIATYGLTAVPILQSCVARSKGKYRGLLVRKERKRHGSLKLIEGPLDPDEPIILIDDSISSGTSSVEACELLEQAGLRVEGGVFLVRFGWYGGYALMQERGYHVEAVSDIWDDFMKYMEDEELPLANPSKWFPAFEWSESRAPEGHHPATLARLAIGEYLATGKLLRAPERMDTEYDAAGGTWVSIRSRADVHHRYAREGFWHFPGEAYKSTAEDVMLASLRTAIELPAGEEGQRILAESGIAVTFFGALERCTVGQLDNDRYGIVVRSLERPSTMGGALPRMPGIRNEWEQFQHARRKNGQLISFEPFEIFRHDLVKAVEPETEWQPTGVPAAEKPWYQAEVICGRLALRARDIVVSQMFRLEETTEPLPDDLTPEDVDSMYVTVYMRGHLSGCMGSNVHKLDDDLRRLATAALEDERFGVERPASPADIAISVSVLFNPLELGEAAPDEIQPYYKCGEQALIVYRGQELGLLLPFVAATHNLDSPSFAQAVVEKSGLNEPPYYWCRLDGVTWLADSEATSELFCGFPRVRVQTPAIERLSQYANWHSNYLARQQRPDGSFYSYYEPFQDQQSDEQVLSRSAHTAWVAARAHQLLSRPDLLEVSEKAIARMIPLLSEDGCWICGDESPNISEIAFLVLALCSLPETNLHRTRIDSLTETLWTAARQPHGRILTHRDPTANDDLFQDYFPGQVLLALAVLSQQNPAQVDLDVVHRCFKYYRHRFRYQRHFGQVSWLMQAFANWWQVTRDGCFAEFVFEIGDWILTYQQEKTGGFINDHQSDSPGYTTAVYLEGIGAAFRVAASLGDSERSERYRRSFLEGFRFLDRLILQPRDASILPNFELACGGLRESLYSSRIRLDFVQHSLSAILEFRAAQLNS